MKKSLKWFQERIWKTIYRDELSCKCDTCVNGWLHWIKILSENHAGYLYTVHCELNIEYYDTQDKQLDKLKTIFWF